VDTALRPLGNHVLTAPTASMPVPSGIQRSGDLGIVRHQRVSAWSSRVRAQSARWWIVAIRTVVSAGTSLPCWLRHGLPCQLPGEAPWTIAVPKTSASERANDAVR
jgi:hypothetical protein